MNANFILRYTVFLIAGTVHLARHDDMFHSICLALCCSSLVRHWASFVTPTIAWIDRALAHVCYGMCAVVHLWQHPNAIGAICLALVLGLWASEFWVKDWARPHALLHVVAFFGIRHAIQVRI